MYSSVLSDLPNSFSDIKQSFSKEFLENRCIARSMKRRFLDYSVVVAAVLAAFLSFEKSSDKENEVPLLFSASSSRSSVD